MRPYNIGINSLFDTPSVFLSQAGGFFAEAKRFAISVPAFVAKKKLRVLLGRGVFRYLAGEDYSQVRFQMAKRSPFFSAAEGQLFTISMVQSPLTLKAWL